MCIRTLPGMQWASNHRQPLTTLTMRSTLSVGVSFADLKLSEVGTVSNDLRNLRANRESVLTTVPEWTLENLLGGGSYQKLRRQREKRCRWWWGHEEAAWWGGWAHRGRTRRKAWPAKPGRRDPPEMAVWSRQLGLWKKQCQAEKTPGDRQPRQKRQSFFYWL